MIQHMNLVFQADGLSVGEGAFLMACCNHTDDKGYVIASMQQLADEAHMKERTARENKQRLIKLSLLAAAVRYHPKTGARIADLYRVNIDLLRRMQRKRTDYGPTVLEELTFATPEETAGQPPRRNPPPPPAESAAPPAESAGGVPADSAPLLLPSSSPSSLSGLGSPSGDAGPAGEREAAAPEDTPSAAEAPTSVEAVVDAYAAALGRPLSASRRVRLWKQADELLRAGYPVEWVAARAAEMPEHGWTDLALHCERSRTPLPGQQAGPSQSPGVRAPGGPGAPGLSAAARAILANASGL
ncbi:hypothetical protein ACGFX2_39635 [Streptomyces goshikiensis]|uniref:hypothetical protein n=1 Tax=Streptomyces goshikiensis TaxID=1942 RepID=UPI00371DDF99